MGKWAEAPRRLCAGPLAHPPARVSVCSALQPRLSQGSCAQTPLGSGAMGFIQPRLGIEAWNHVGFPV